MTATPENYKIFAIKYAHHDRPARDNFIGGDPHDVNMPLDYFVWAVVGESRTFLVDTGFDAEVGAQRGRIITHSVEEGLGAIGIRPETVEDVIVTHMHYDHAGNRSLFPKARYHVQDREMAYCTGRCMCHGALNHPFNPEDVKSMVGRVFRRSRGVSRRGIEPCAGLERASGRRSYRRSAGRACAHGARLGRARVRRLASLREHGTEPPIPGCVQRRRHDRRLPPRARTGGFRAARRAWPRPGGIDALSGGEQGDRRLDRSARRDATVKDVLLA
jgi:hypothetical protein